MASFCRNLGVSLFAAFCITSCALGDNFSAPLEGTRPQAAPNPSVVLEMLEPFNYPGGFLATNAPAVVADASPIWRGPGYNNGYITDPSIAGTGWDANGIPFPGDRALADANPGGKFLTSIA